MVDGRTGRADQPSTPPAQREGRAEKNKDGTVRLGNGGCKLPGSDGRVAGGFNRVGNEIKRSGRVRDNIMHGIPTGEVSDRVLMGGRGNEINAVDSNILAPISTVKIEPVSGARSQAGNTGRVDAGIISNNQV